MSKPLMLAEFGTKPLAPKEIAKIANDQIAKLMAERDQALAERNIVLEEIESVRKT